ncbi:hypothetical protein Taro_054151 [Colocasia esculenta]|uniref:Uncharacterized protein n=1 Tax=Colocasia esculenta TaxID=4460 RepID=A0A843XN49_COLES|nr:hypothetical protein [Colocasia esculenta]
MALLTTQSSSQPNTTSIRSRVSALCYLLSSAAALALRLSCFPGGKFPYQLACLCSRPICLLQLFRTSASRSYRRVVRSLPRFWVMLFYFVSTSFLGFLFLKLFAPAAGTPRVPSDLDLFFMAVSAVTVSSMSTAEMGALSNGQFVVLAILMLVGGEVFTSMAELHLMETELGVEVSTPVVSANGSSPAADSSPGGTAVATDLADSNFVELGLAAAPAASGDLNLAKSKEQGLKIYNSLKTLSAVVFVYLVLAHVAGSMAILLYLISKPAPRGLLVERGVSTLGFSVFMTISSFANAGFVPLNEGMAPFKQSPGVLLLIVPLVLAGNTLFPPLLRWAVRLSKAVVGGELSKYILENTGEIGFQHLLSTRRSACLLFTVAGFVCLQVVAFCWIEWGGAALEGLSAYQKVVGGLYMAVNSRHAGESPFDLSAVSSAVLVLYVVMMYLPPYTSFVPAMEDHDDQGGEVDGEPLKRGQAAEKVGGWKLVLRAVLESLSMSHLSYLAICVMLICITERRKLAHDPLNFNVLYIVVEVIRQVSI